MADLVPFYGFYFNPQKVKLENSIIRLERFTLELDNPDRENLLLYLLTKGKDLAQSEKIFREWIEDETILKVPYPSFFLHRERFTHRNKEYERFGIIAAMKIVSFGEGIILPHEQTFYQGTRLYLDFMQRVGKNFEQVFILYEDPSFTLSNSFSLIKEKKPLLEVKDELDCLHTIWAIEDSGFSKKLKKCTGSQSLVIADGHHRYEASLLYKNLMKKKYPSLRDAPFQYRLVNLTNVYDSGVIILPTHRIYMRKKFDNFDIIMRKIKEKFSVEETSISNLTKLLETKGQGFIGFYKGGETGYLIQLRDTLFLNEVLPNLPTEYKTLDVVILHEILFGNLFKIDERYLNYMRNAEEALHKVKEGEASWAFLLNPPKPFQVKRIAEMGLRMPAKSTDFYPKLVAGLMFFDLLPG